jgi:hypothetical protein
MEQHNVMKRFIIEEVIQLTLGLGKPVSIKREGCLQARRDHMD